ncbi:hypothetical protein BS636_10875 [Acinetobacter sp. LoGeW2-3]|uniref:hypothetical protein n=1 Tax=Acinetobacter sp. LoGeW2-3 TaxID=1808001 RepID=UPI000C05A755|nr:hypothetical protein [Acinetobacter sp. LoGeW2-3]ATO20126.1 hypothetical protein BS636_10875 [Acinetobacter sp. LoGeW2-3]
MTALIISKVLLVGSTFFIRDLSTSDISIEDRFFEASCNDALVYSTNDEIYLEFMREAGTLDFATQNAIKDIEMTITQSIQIRVNNKPYATKPT